MPKFFINEKTKGINICICPEGGFTESEWEFATSKGIKSVTQGKRILRTETASVFVIAAAMYEYGELDKKHEKTRKTE